MIVALIGRPNVGKSTLFNRMVTAGRAGRNITAITEETPGVTRDRNYGVAEWEDKRCTVVDTGGLWGEESVPGERDIAAQVREQALCAIDEADMVLHVMDGRDGLTPPDIEIATLLRKSGKKVITVVNKIDSPKRRDGMADFWRLGPDRLIEVSGITGFGCDELMEEVFGHGVIGGTQRSSEEWSAIPKVAVVGRPNVGKSTFINALLSKKRLIVSATPGTTRDAIDSVCTYHGRRYLLIDTAGIRRKSVSRSLESLSVLRALRSIERADVALIVLDAAAGVVDQDQRISGFVGEAGKGAVFLLNKWDLLTDREGAYKRLTADLKRKMWFMDYAPVLTTSGLSRKRMTAVFPLIDEIVGVRRMHVAQDELQDFIAAMSVHTPFQRATASQLRFLGISQIGTEPPSFMVRVNNPEKIRDAHRRHFEKALRARFRFRGTPIRIYFKSR
jgi:GTP-binding protein